MTEQQYTCPFCHEDYTRFTIAEHYGCGVEPLETTEEIEQELESISEEVAMQESPAEEESLEGLPTETIQPVEVKAEPKKRGRKPKEK